MTLLAVLSDSHDQVANLQAAIKYCNEADVDTVVHCGDLISPFMLKQLARFTGHVHLIFGNNIGDQELISKRCGHDFPNITHHGTVGSFVIAQYTIAMVHYPEQARVLASQSNYDIVCCGHSHKHGVESFADTLLINPGHLLGENRETGFTIIDLEKLSIQRINIDTCMFDHNLPVQAAPPQQLTAAKRMGVKPLYG